MSGLSLLSDIAQTGHENNSQTTESFAEASQTDPKATSNQNGDASTSAEYSHTIPFKFVPDTDTTTITRDLLPARDQQPLSAVWNDRWTPIQHAARQGHFRPPVPRLDRSLQWMLHADDMGLSGGDPRRGAARSFLHPGLIEEQSSTAKAVELHLRQRERHQRQLQQIRLLQHTERQREATLKLMRPMSGLSSTSLPMPQTAVGRGMQPDSAASQIPSIPAGTAPFGHHPSPMIGANIVPGSSLNNILHDSGSVSSNAVNNHGLGGRLLPKPIGFDNLNSVNETLPLNMNGLVSMKRSASAAHLPADENFKSKRTRRRERHNNTELRRMAKIRRGIEELKEVMELDGVNVKGGKADILSRAVQHMRKLQATICELRGGRPKHSGGANSTIANAETTDGGGSSGSNGGGDGDIGGSVAVDTSPGDADAISKKRDQADGQDGSGFGDVDEDNVKDGNVDDVDGGADEATENGRAAPPAPRPAITTTSVTAKDDSADLAAATAPKPASAP